MVLLVNVFTRHLRRRGRCCSHRRGGSRSVGLRLRAVRLVLGSVRVVLGTIGLVVGFVGVDGGLVRVVLRSVGSLLGAEVAVRGLVIERVVLRSVVLRSDREAASVGGKAVGLGSEARSIRGEAARVW